MFENSMLRKIIGPKRKKVSRGWKELHNGDLNNFYSSLNLITRINEERGMGRDTVQVAENCIQNFGRKN
jgi:hypothetical protein